MQRPGFLLEIMTRGGNIVNVWREGGGGGGGGGDRIVHASGPSRGLPEDI